VTWIERFGIEKANDMKYNSNKLKKGKTYEEIYGIEQAQIERNKRIPTLKNWRKKNPEKAIQAARNSAITNSKNTSFPQQKLFKLIKKILPTEKVEMEFPVKLKRLRLLDIALPELKLDFEYDGEHWHTDKEKDKQRDLELTSMGWTVLRYNKDNFNEENIKKDLFNTGVFL
jgi:very-short-patch-repair endonuclease